MKTKINTEVSCQGLGKMAKHMSVHYYKENTGGFRINGSDQGFEADVRGGLSTCVAKNSNGADLKSISKYEGMVCLAIIKAACKSIEEKTEWILD